MFAPINYLANWFTQLFGFRHERKHVSRAPVSVRLGADVVLEVRDLPSITTATDAFVIKPPQPYTSQVSVLANDSNSYELAMSAAQLQGPTHAQMTMNADGTFELSNWDGTKGYDRAFYAATVEGPNGIETATGQMDLLWTDTIHWTGAGDGTSWSDADNWEGNALPGEFDDVIIDIPGINIVIGEYDVVKIRSLQYAANLEVQGQLTLLTGDSFVNGAFNVAGTLQVDAGSLTLRGGGTFDCNLYVAEDASVVLAQGAFVAQNILAPAPPAMHYRSLIVGAEGIGASLTVGAGTTIEVENLTLDREGTLDGAGTFRVIRSFSWIGGTMSGAGTTAIASGANALIDANTTSARGIVNYGKLVIEQRRTLTLAGIDLSNYGELELRRGSGIARSGAARLINVWDGVFQLGAVHVRAAGGFASIDVLVDNRGVVNVQGGTLIIESEFGNNAGGSLGAVEGARIRVSANLFTFTFAQGSSFNGDGVLVLNNGIMRVEQDTAIAITSFEMQSGSILAGAGTLTVNTFAWTGGGIVGSISIRINTGSTMTITVGNPRPMIGEHATIYNEGIIRFGGVGFLLMSEDARITNDGVGGEGRFQIESGADIDEDENEAPNTRLELINGGVLSLASTGGGNSIKSSFLNNHGKLELNGRNLTLFKLYSPVSAETLLDGGSLTCVAGLVQTGGISSLQGGSIVAQSVILVNDARLFLDAGSVSASTLTVGQNAQLIGGGFIDADLVNQGLISISYGGLLPLSSLQISGNYTQTVSGILNIRVTGHQSADILRVTGTATLNGDLLITLDGTFVEGDMCDVLEYQELQGSFASVYDGSQQLPWQIQWGDQIASLHL